MKRVIFISACLLLALFITFPFLAFAGGLVPCGGAGEPACTLCHVIELANRVLNFLFRMIILPLIALGILASGIVLLTAGGSPTQLSKGKSMLWHIVIGFFIALFAWIVIYTILGTIVSGGMLFNPLVETFPACAPFGS